MKWEPLTIIDALDKKVAARLVERRKQILVSMCVSQDEIGMLSINPTASYAPFVEYGIPPTMPPSGVAVIDSIAIAIDPNIAPLLEKKEG